MQSIIGRTIRIEGVRYRVAGKLPDAWSLVRLDQPFQYFPLSWSLSTPLPLDFVVDGEAEAEAADPEVGKT